MDECDAAQAVESLARRAALNRALADLAGPEAPLYLDGRRCCLDCEEPIPAARLAARPEAVRCVTCQEDHDRSR